MKKCIVLFLLVLSAFSSKATSTKTVNATVWKALLGSQVELVGFAQNRKLGAVLQTKAGTIWIDGLEQWPKDFYLGEEKGKRLCVTGTVIERYDKPIFVHKEGVPMQAGISVPEETNLKEAKHRYLLKDAKWNVQDLGIGFVVAKNPYEFEGLPNPKSLFKDKDCSIPWTSKTVFPFFLKPDYGLYHFICLEKNNKHYKILANDSEIGYLPTNAPFQFMTWKEVLIQSTVERKSKDQPIRKSPNIHSDTLVNPCELDRLTVQDVLQKDGIYWLHIYFSPQCEDYFEKSTKVEHGWIQWRTFDRLLVNILPLF